jgi:hypothetical protein
MCCVDAEPTKGLRKASALLSGLAQESSDGHELSDSVLHQLQAFTRFVPFSLVHPIID